MFKAINLTYKINYEVIVNSVSFNLNEGQLLQIVGTNGSGKSTLLRMLSSSLSPSSGSCYWDGKDIIKDSISFLDNIAYLGHTNGLKENVSVAYNLKLSSNLFGYDFNIKNYLKNSLSFLTLLKELKVFELLDKNVNSLSAGQKRRVAIACLFIKRPKLLLLDEPYLTVDDLGKEVMQNLFKQHLHNGGMFVMTTHTKLSFEDFYNGSNFNQDSVKTMILEGAVDV